MQYPEVNAKNPIDISSDSVHLHSDQEKCPKCRGKFLFCFSTGEIKEAFCKAYSCPVCGNYKKYQLEKAINDYVKSWDAVRMWTFTFSSHIFDGLNLEERIKKASTIWKTFRDLLARDIYASHFVKKFQYIKIMELQKNGSPHYHALLDRFVYHATMQRIWQKAISYHTKHKGSPGGVEVEGNISKRIAGKYITKYITKQLTDIKENILFRRWSKSGKGSMFAKKEVSGEWGFIHLYSSSVSITSTIEFAIWQREEVKNAIIPLFPILKPPEPPPINDFFYGTD